MCSGKIPSFSQASAPGAWLPSLSWSLALGLLGYGWGSGLRENQWDCPGE